MDDLILRKEDVLEDIDLINNELMGVPAPSMDDLILKKEDVLEAFALINKKWTGVPAACAEFNISRAAIHQWKAGEPIPDSRQLHLFRKRPDIIAKVSEIQKAAYCADNQQCTDEEAA